MAVYDDKDKQPKRRAREFGSHDLLQEEKSSLSESGDKGTKSAATPNQLLEKESGANQTDSGQRQPDDVLGKGFTGSTKAGRSKQSKTKRLVRLFGQGSHTKTIALAGGGVTGVVVIVLIGLFALIPLKIESIVSNLESHFFASTDNAVENESDNMLQNYFSKYVSPELKHCGSTINKDCHVSVSSSSNPVTSLYRVFSENKLEYTLANDYGIELSYVTHEHGGTYYLKAPGANDTVDGDVISVGEDPAGIDPDLLGKTMGRNEVRTTINEAVSTDSHWKNVLMRFKVGRLLEEKYGIERCIVFCGIRDAFADAKSNAKYAFKAYLLERVIQPRSSSLGAVVDCLLNNNCDGAASQETCAEGTDCAELNDATELSGDEAVSSALESASADFGTDTADSLMATISASRAAGGFSTYIVQQTASKIFGADISGDEIPAWGEVMIFNQLAKLASAGGNATSTLKKMSYAVDAAAAVSLYMMYRSFADELKTGHDSAAEVGSFTDALGEGDQCVKSLEGTCPTSPVNGTAGAEQTPLYESLMDGQSPTPTSATGKTADLSLLGTAYAAGADGTAAASSSSTYLCNDDNPVPSGSLVCPEEQLGQSNKYISEVSDLIQTSGLGEISGIYNDTLGKVVSFVGNFTSDLFEAAISASEKAFEQLPGGKAAIGGIQSYAQGKVSTFFDWLVNKLVPSPFSEDESGGRTFDEMAAGADVAGSDYAHNGLGGEQLTPKDVATIDNQQTQEAGAEFKQESFFARIFDTTTPYSLISRLAMDMPLESKGSTIQQAASTILSDPFTGLFHGLASVFNRSDSVFATSAMVNDPFGVTQYGYTANDIPSDPETYWAQNCTNGTALQNYNQQAAQQTDDNGNPVNASPDRCLLIQATVGSVGGYYDSSLLSSDDLADSNSNGSTTTTTTPTASNSNYYQIGDSLSVGMASDGLTSDLTNEGWNVTKIEANTGYSIAESQALLSGDEQDIAESGAIVVELGTNDIYSTQDQVEGSIQNMFNAVRALNPTAPIYWVNTYSKLLSGYNIVNAAINTEATSLGYTVLDWASEATSNPSLYDFNTSDGLGVHQATGAGYQAMSNWLARLIGAPSTTQTSSLVRSLLDTPSSPSVINRLATAFKSFDNLFNAPVKLQQLNLSKRL